MQAIEEPRIELPSSGNPSSASAATVSSTLLLRDARDDEVLLARDRDVAAVRLRQLGDADHLVARDEAEVDRDADRCKAVALGLDAEVVGERTGRLERVVGQRVAEAALELGAHPVGAVVVDHELHPRLHARDAVAEVLLPGVEERAEHGQRLVGADEDAEVARESRHRGEAAAGGDGEARLAVAQDADERDAVDLGRVAAVRARGDRDLVLARQVRVVGVAVEELGGLLEDRRRVEELVVGEPGERAAGDVANGVAARARGREAGRLERGEHLRQRRQLEVVELDVLARRELALAAAEAVRDLADRRSCAGVTRPPGSLIRSMNVPIFGLSW